MLNVKKNKKSLIITISVILGIFVIIAVFLGIYYLCADALVYYYVDVHDAYVDGVNYPHINNEEDYPRRYPFFGNPLTISEESGTSIHFPLHGGERYFFVYDAINDPIKTWIFYLSLRYKNDARVDYTVEQDSEYITVNFTGTLTENGENIPIEQKFIFDIRGVATYLPPTWTNSDEISEGYREFLFYCNNQGYPDKIETPDWILNPTH